MTATSHSLIGVSLAKFIPNPFIALTVAFFSNFLLDLVPHWDTGTNWRKRPIIKTVIYTGIDVLLGLVLCLFLFGGKVNLFYLLALVLAATLVDYLEAPYLFLNWNFFPFKQFYQLSSKLHHKDASWFGIFTQVIVVVPILFLSLHS